MKVNIQKERSFNKNEKEKLKKRKAIKSQNKIMEREETQARLTSLNSDIERLYKKYAEIKKERLLKEKSQQILVNRLKYLRNEAKRSVSKKEKPLKKIGMDGEEKNKKIFVKINSKYKNNGIDKRSKESEKPSIRDIFTDNDSLSKISFNGNESEIIGSSYKSINPKKLNNNNTNKKSSTNINSGKENNQNENNSGEINKNNNDNNNIEDLLKNYKYNIGNRNSNNNIYIIINNPNQNLCKEKSLKNILDNNNNYDYDNCTPKDNFLDKLTKNRNNNIIDLGEEGENIILMNANGRKLQDIINSINNFNFMNNKNNDSSDKKEKLNKKKGIEKASENSFKKEKDNSNNNSKLNVEKGKEMEKEKEKEKEKKELNNKNEDKVINNIIDSEKFTKEEKNDGFVRPSFLNLYKNEENSEIKQKIDINSYRDTNRFDNTILQTTENKRSNNKEENEHIESKQLYDNKKINNINNEIIKNLIHQHKNVNSDNHLMTFNNNYNEKNDLKILNNQLKQKKLEHLKENNTIWVDNFDHYKQYNSVNTTNNKIKNTFISSEEKDKDNLDSNNGKEENNIIRNNQENIYYQLNNQKNNYHNNFLKINNKQINYSLSFKELNNNKKKITSSRDNNYNTKWNINLEKIRKNNFRKDSYCSTIEKKRKALGLDFKSNFGRELSIQTEKNTAKKNKILEKLKNKDLKNRYNFYKTNFYDVDKLIKVRKKEVYKTVEKRFNFLKKSIEKEKINHKMMKNKTSINFNYKQSNLNNNKTELRNKKITNDILNILNNNESASNKTADGCFNHLI